MADKSPLKLADWPYNPYPPKLRSGMSKRDGAGKTHNKRPVWWEKGVGEVTNGKTTSHSEVVKGGAPRNRRERRG